ISQAIAHGITKTGVTVEMMDLRSTDPQEVNAQWPYPMLAKLDRLHYYIVSSQKWIPRFSKG
ncbi:MAG: hypothetical protein F6K42_19285, partial [Leptolyngbya sp. SIO1D8]|nr:hypothetical protein [Leptolyngbya sp. SIO1D8]